ncbi:MAG TPA: class I tRNA ligase family protein, partial [Solirubrobacteraceae bacterium]|nr:class I tRNA ligase family protein [Solirubrobacteraceae bacterium]
LEAAKVRLYSNDAAQAQVARDVLAGVLDDLLRLLHPFIPFVTEVLWRELTGSKGGRESLAVASWPRVRAGRDHEAEDQFAIVQELVGEVRRFRSEQRIAPRVRIEATVVSPQRASLEPHAHLIRALAGIGTLEFADTAPQLPGASRVVFPSGEVFVGLGASVDADAEVARLRRELAAAEGEVARATAKLGNEQFVARAPADVVQREREKRDEWVAVIDKIRARVDELAGAPGGG